MVADEVRKLAERSSRETKQIADLIQQVQAGTRHAVKAMQAGAAKVEQGSQKAELAGQALDAILAAVEHTVKQAGEIASASHEMALGARQVTEAMTSISAIVEENTAATEEMSAQSGQVAQAIQSIAAVSEEQSASTEEVSASAEQMSAQIEEMSAQAQELSSTAEELRQLVARFRLQTPPTSGVTATVTAGVTPSVTQRNAAPKVVTFPRAAAGVRLERNWPELIEAHHHRVGRAGAVQRHHAGGLLFEQRDRCCASTCGCAGR